MSSLWPSRAAAPRSTTVWRQDRIYAGHVIMSTATMICGKTELSREGVLLRHESGTAPVEHFLLWSRSVAPAAYPMYVSGGGGVMSSDVSQYLASTLVDVPPLLWIEEDTQLGRLTAPYVLPVKDPRFHNYFSATPNVDYAFRGQVPRAYLYCSRQSWVVHKYPWESLGRVGVDGVLHCTERDFLRGAAEGASLSNSAAAGGRHMCFSQLNQSFGGIWPTWRLANPKYYTKAPPETNRQYKGRKRVTGENTDGPSGWCNEDSMKNMMAYTRAKSCHLYP